MLLGSLTNSTLPPVDPELERVFSLSPHLDQIFSKIDQNEDEMVAAIIES
jgi:hypothetical protein